MNRRDLRKFWWNLVDPLVERLMWRMDHLRREHRSDDFYRRWKSSGRIDPSAKFFAETRIDQHSVPDNLIIGKYSHIRGELSLVSPVARIEIGDYCFLGEGSRVWSRESVKIGNYVLISHLVDIHDNNSHALNYAHRRREAKQLFETGKAVYDNDASSRRIVIEDDVWIGFKSSILKGVTVGKGAVIAAGTVVTKDVEAFTVVAGNPARVVSRIEGEG